MAVKYLCDACGTEGAARFCMSLSTAKPVNINWDPRDMELCQGCADKVVTVLNTLLPKQPKAR